MTIKVEFNGREMRVDAHLCGGSDERVHISTQDFPPNQGSEGFFSLLCYIHRDEGGVLPRMDQINLFLNRDQLPQLRDALLAACPLPPKGWEKIEGDDPPERVPLELPVVVGIPLEGEDDSE